MFALAAARGMLHATRDGIKESELRETRRELLASFCDEIMQKINIADEALTSLLREEISLKDGAK